MKKKWIILLLVLILLFIYFIKKNNQEHIPPTALASMLPDLAQVYWKQNTTENIGWKEIDEIWNHRFQMLKPIHISPLQRQLIKAEEKAVILCNHLPNIDYFYLIQLCYKSAPTSKFSVIYATLPPVLNQLCLNMGWGEITQTIPYFPPDTQSILNAAHSTNWVIIFPEGAFLNQKNRKLAHYKRQDLNQRKKLKLQAWKHLLLPRPRGLFILLKSGQLDYIYDFTVSFLGYKGDMKEMTGKNPLIPSYEAIFNEDRSGGIVYTLRKVSIKETFGNLEDLTLEKVACWLNKSWDRKEQLLEYFVHHQTFPE